MWESQPEETVPKESGPLPNYISEDPNNLDKNSDTLEDDDVLAFLP